MRLRRILWTVAVAVFLLGAFIVYSVGQAFLFSDMEGRGESTTVSGPGDTPRRIRYICIGEGQLTVIFESSGFGTAESFAQARQEISKQVRVCSYDRAGMGWSDPGPSVISAGFLADDLDRFIEHAHLTPPFVFVPSSFGGIPVELFARRHAEQVLGLVFVDAGNSILAKEVASRPRPGITALACLLPAAAMVGLLEVANPFGVTDRRARIIAYRPEAMGTLCGIARGLRQSEHEFETAPPLRSDIPLTVLVHEKPDGLVPPKLSPLIKNIEPVWLQAQQQFAARSSRGTWKIVPGSDHLIADSQPHAVASAVLEMIGGQNPAR